MARKDLITPGGTRASMGSQRSRLQPPFPSKKLREPSLTDLKNPRRPNRRLYSTSEPPPKVVTEQVLAASKRSRLHGFKTKPCRLNLPNKRKKRAPRTKPQESAWLKRFCRRGKTSLPNLANSLKTAEPLSQGEMTSKPPERPKTTCNSIRHKNQSSKKTIQTTKPISNHKHQLISTLPSSSNDEKERRHETEEKRRGIIGTIAEIASTKHLKNPHTIAALQPEAEKIARRKPEITPPQKREPLTDQQEELDTREANAKLAKNPEGTKSEPPATRYHHQPDLKTNHREACLKPPPPTLQSHQTKNGDIRALSEEKPQPQNHHLSLPDASRLRAAKPSSNQILRRDTPCHRNRAETLIATVPPPMLKRRFTTNKRSEVDGEPPSKHLREQNRRRRRTKETEGSPPRRRKRHRRGKRNRSEKFGEKNLEEREERCACSPRAGFF